MGYPGIDQENALREGGFSDEEIQEWKGQITQELSDNGFSLQEIKKDYFGIKEPNLEPVKTFFKENLAKTNETSTTQTTPATTPGAVSTSGAVATQTKATSFLEAMEAGWQMSVEGLIDRGKLPDKVLPEDAPMFYNIASQIGMLKGDIPDMIVGSLAGSVIGSVAGPIGTAVGAGAGGFAFPAAIRETLVQAYEKGEVKSFRDFWERTSAVFIETAKNAAIGGATGGVGGAVGKVLGPAVSPLVSGTTKTASEVATMVTVGKAIEGEMPEPHHFAEAAILVGGLKGSAKVASKLGNTFSKTGLKPDQVAMDSIKNPVIKQELVSENIQVPKAYENLIEKPKVETNVKAEVKAEAPPSKAETPPVARTPLEEAQAKIREQIGTKTEKDGKPYTRDDFYKDYIDKLDPINNAQKLLKKNLETLAADQNPYQLARQSVDAKAKVKYAFEKGTLDYQTLSQTGKSFKDILEPFKKDPRAFEAYLVSKRTVELETRGIKSGFDKASAELIVKEGKSKFEAAAQEYVEFQNQNLKYLKDSGYISEKSYAAMTEAGKAYVPFRRIFEEVETGGKAGKGSSLKKIKGSEKEIQSPFLSTLENTEVIFKLAEKNRASRALVELAEKTPEQTILEKVHTSKQIELTPDEISRITGGKEGAKENFSIYRKGDRPLSRNEFEVYRDGKREVWKTQSTELAEAIKSLDGDIPSTNIFFKFARGITSVKKFGIAITPEFITKNLFRDQLTAGVFSKKGTISISEMVSALGDIIGKKDAYYNHLKSGGAGGTFLDMSEAYLKDNIFRLNEKTGFLDASFNVVKKPVDFLRAAAQLGEQMTRLVEFKRVAKGQSSGEKVFAGGYASREITVDFVRSGAKISALNSITAFQNVSIQGLDRTIRAAKADPKGIALKAGLYITTPSILLWWANKDDQRVQSLPRWQKDMFWIVATDNWEKQDSKMGPFPDYLTRKNEKGETEVNTGTIYRLPKPQELGLVFGSLPERIMESFFTDNPRALKDFEETLLNLITPSFIPDAIAPAIEQYFNKSLFTGGPIIPGHMEGILPAYQYTEYTSETAKALGKMIAVIPGMDNPGSLAAPQVLDNYIRSWSGTLGVYVNQMIDEALIATGAVPDPVKPDGTLSDIPFVKAFIVRFPSAQAQQIVDFRERYRETKAVTDTISFLAKNGNLEFQQVMDEHTEDLVNLQSINDALTQSGKAIRGIYKNKDLSSSDKRQQIDGIYYGMIEMAKAGLTLSDKFKEQAEAIVKENGINKK